MAVALVAASLAQETVLAPGLILSRVFTIQGQDYAIENGVARDMLKAGMIMVAAGASRAENERFVVTELGFGAVLDLLGRAALIDLGAVDPE
jgi:hypothetical protein